MLLDLPGRPLPFFETGAPPGSLPDALTLADLMQLLGKYRGQVSDTAAGAAPSAASSSYIPMLRRRRR